MYQQLHSPVHGTQSSSTHKQLPSGKSCRRRRRHCCCATVSKFQLISADAIQIQCARHNGRNERTNKRKTNTEGKKQHARCLRETVKQIETMGKTKIFTQTQVFPFVFGEFICHRWYLRCYAADFIYFSHFTASIFPSLESTLFFPSRSRTKK